MTIFSITRKPYIGLHHFLYNATFNAFSTLIGAQRCF